MARSTAGARDAGIQLRKSLLSKNLREFGKIGAGSRNPPHAPLEWLGKSPAQVRDAIAF
jgi:hypothetical protein